MSKVQEIDKEMDVVYDSVLVLNSAVTAIIKSLPYETAVSVVQSLDAVIAEIQEYENPPEGLPLATLHGWRNMAAKQAGVPQTFYGA